MSRAMRILAMVFVVGAALTSSACYGPGTTYVGVSGPGPWVGYPYPGRYPPYGGGRVWVGVPICCDAPEAPLPEQPQQPEDPQPQQPEAGDEADSASAKPSHPEDDGA